MSFTNRQSFRVPLSVALPLLLLPAGCSTFSRSADQRPAVTTAPGCDPERDRRAILAMAGGYKAAFRFAETVALAPGYELDEPYEVDATELVIVAEDRPGHVVLQHILAMGQGDARKALKHWRQDWTFEPTEVLQYRGGETWEKRAVPAGEARCAWAQQVYGIEDGPRYGSWGRWVHEGGASTWTSGDTWRPLPRRESDREDYDVIVGVNRHTITPRGWVHEQDNGKLALRGKNLLIARERGVIPYDRTTEEDFTAVSRYWQETQAFWKEVRDGWTDVIAARGKLTFVTGPKQAKSKTKSLNAELEELRGKPAVTARRQEIVQTISRHLVADQRLASETAGAIR